MPHPITLFFTSLLARLPGRLLALLLALGLTLLGAAPARATHIVGGELDLRYLQGNTYQLTLNLYFDAKNGAPAALDQDLTAGIFDKATNERKATLTLPLVSNTFLNYTSPACAIGDLQTRALIYRNTIELPPGTYDGPQGYYVAVERCCRNNGIFNIVAPGSAGQAFYLEFPAVVRGGQPFRDSTPRVFPPLSDYACLGETFFYDFGGQDPDRDSLAYELITPLNGHADPVNSKPPVPSPAPYADITWNTGLGVLNQIPGAPTLSVNARTGRLTVRPLQQKLFVFGVRCTEYRAGVKIGETRRDFQLLVVACPKNAAPQLALLPGAGPAVYQSGRDTLRLGPGRPRCVRLRFTDPDPNSRLTLSLLPAQSYTGPLPTFTTAVSGTVRGPGLPDTLTATLCFSECTDTQGKVARLDVLVADNGCALPKRDTVRVAFIGVPPPNASPTLVSTAGVNPPNGLPLRVKPGQTLAFDLTATDPDADPILFTLGGSPASFVPAALGVVLTPQAQTGTTRTARLTWPVDCRAIIDPPGTVRELLLQATSTTPCGTVRASNVVRVPVVVDYSNLPPALTSTLPAAATASGPVPLVVLPLGQPYSATLVGLDADLDVLTLSAAGQGFELATAGMRFSTVPSPAGQASGTFSWLPACAGGVSVVSGQARDLTVVFTLQEATCRAQPQTRTVRFRVQAPEAPPFVPPNIVLPVSEVTANRVFTLPTLPPDFCDARFAGVKIFSRWGRLVYESPDRSFAWRGEGAAGLYYYLLTFENGKPYKGWVEVVR